MDHEKLRMSIKLSTKTFDSEKKNEIMCSGKKKALKEVWGYDDIVWK